MCLSVCARVCEGIGQIARMPFVHNGPQHCTISTFHASDFTLSDMIPAAKKIVSINKQLLCGIQVSDDHCQLSAPLAAQNYVA